MIRIFFYSFSLLFFTTFLKVCAATPYALSLSIIDSTQKKGQSAYNAVAVKNNGSKNVTLNTPFYTTVGDSTTPCIPPACHAPSSKVPVCMHNMTLAPGEQCYFWVHYTPIPSAIGPEYVIRYPFSITVTTKQGLRVTKTAPAVYQEFAQNAKPRPIITGTSTPGF